MTMPSGGMDTGNAAQQHGGALSAVEQKLSGLLSHLQDAHQPSLASSMQQAVRVELSMHDLETAGSTGGVEGEPRLVPPHMGDAACLTAGPLPLPDLPSLLTNLQAAVDQGQWALSTAYTHRSLASALPKAGCDTTDPELLKRQLSVLREGILGLHEMHKFRDAATSLLCRAASKLGADGAASSEAVLDLSARLLHQLWALDALKATRHSMSRDLDAYVSTVHRLEESGTPLPDGCSSGDPDSAALQEFLERPRCCLEGLAERLEGVEGARRALAQLVHHVYYALKGSSGPSAILRLPAEHFALLGSLPVLLLLLAARGETAAGGSDGSSGAITVASSAPAPAPGSAAAAAAAAAAASSAAAAAARVPAGVEAVTRSRVVKCLRILRRHPVLPGIGDLVLQPGAILSLSPFLVFTMQEAKDTRVLPVAQMDAKGAAEVRHHHNAAAQAEQVTAQHFQVVSRLIALQVTLSELPAASEPPPQLYQEAVASARAALGALSRWSAQLAQLHAWKVAKATSRAPRQHQQQHHQEDEGLNAPASVVREYEEQELAAITETVTCLKGLAAQLLGCLPWLQPLLDRAAHRQVREFACSTIQHMIKPGSKSAVKDMLIQLQTALAYWPGGVAPEGPGTKAKGFMRAFSKKLETATSAAAHLRKSMAAPLALPAPSAAQGGSCPPSREQSAVARHLLEQLLSAGESAGKRSFLNSADLSATSLRELTDLLDAARHWVVLSDLHSAVLQASDLSDLWLQEQEHELRLVAAEVPSKRRGLSSALLAAALKRPGTGEAALAPLHVLNDACRRALEDFQVAHLYEEVLSEAATWLDIFQKVAAEHLFANAKASAAAQLCDAGLLASSGGPQGLCEGSGVPRRLEALLEHRRLPVMGRSIDLRALIAARLLKLFRANAEHLVARFEASPVSTVVELESQFAVLQRAHELLGESVPLGDWGALWAQADRPSEAPPPSEPSKHDPAPSAQGSFSRVAKRAAEVVCTQILPGYVMSAGRHRLVQLPGLPQGAQAPPLEPPLPCFLLSRHGVVTSPSHIRFAAAHAGWFGEPHLSSLLVLIGSEGIAWLVELLREHALRLLKTTISSSFREAKGAMSSHIHSATLEPGSAGGQAAAAVLSFYRSQLECLQSCQRGLAEALAELGNCVFLVVLADSALQMAGRQEFMQGAPFFGVSPAARSGLCRPALPSGNQPGGASALERLLRATLAPGNLGGVAGGDGDEAADELQRIVGRLMQQAGTQFWDSAIPYGHLQQWLLSLEVAACDVPGIKEGNSSSQEQQQEEEEEEDMSGHGGEAPGAQQERPRVEVHNVLSALLFLVADDQPAPAPKGDSAAAALTAAGSASLSPVLAGDGMQWGAALLLCLLKQERKWHLADFSQVVVDAAALEGLDHHHHYHGSSHSHLPSGRRLSDNGSSSGPTGASGGAHPGGLSRGPRQQSQQHHQAPHHHSHPLAAFLRNASHLEGVMHDAVRAVAVALPAAPAPSVALPHYSRFPRQNEAPASPLQVLIQPDHGPARPDPTLERVPEARPGYSLDFGADASASHEEQQHRQQQAELRSISRYQEPRSPGGSSFASVTTKVHSPSSSLHHVDVNVTRAVSMAMPDSIPENGTNNKDFPGGDYSPPPYGSARDMQASEGTETTPQKPEPGPWAQVDDATDADEGTDAPAALGSAINHVLPQDQHRTGASPQLGESQRKRRLPPPPRNLVQQG